MNKANKQWARQTHGTHGATKRAQGEEYAVFMRRNKRYGWVKAMEEMVAALQDNDVGTITRRAPGCKALHTKWVYKTKATAEGELERLKARLMASVMDLSTVKVILALTATWGGVPSKHGDISNANVKANKEAHLRTYLQLPLDMSVSSATI
uniref:Uncharacterized protein n=1 Tax=Peronospora matthiolae TaxID=2874970 RepID=A0AAV1VCP2_9STRA